MDGEGGSLRWAACSLPSAQTGSGPEAEAPDPRLLPTPPELRGPRGGRTRARKASDAPQPGVPGLCGLQEGHPIHLVREAMGHSTVRVTEGYLHLVATDLLSLVEEPGEEQLKGMAR